MKKALAKIDEVINAPKAGRALLKQMKRTVEGWSTPEKSGFRFGPSSLHYASEYDLVVDYWVPKPRMSLGLDLEMYGAVGQATHDFIQTLLYNMGYLVCEGLDGDGIIEPGFNCGALFSRGRVDGFLALPGIPKEHGLCPLLEIKTVGRYVYDGMRSADDISDRYKMQAEIYQKMFGVTSTWFMFVCRDSMRRKIIVYDMVGSYWQAARDKMIRVIEHAKNHTVPQIEGGLTNGEMQFLITSSLDTRPKDDFYDLTKWSIPTDLQIVGSTVLHSYPLS